MDNVQVRKIALCEAKEVTLRPNMPYVFEAVPGCKKCADLLTEANEEFARLGESFDFTNPKTADYPIYATTRPIPIIAKKAKEKVKRKR